MCVVGGGLIDGASGVGRRARLVCHVLAIETERGLVLVDTALGAQDLAHQEERLPPAFRAIMQVPHDASKTAIERLRALGLDPRDVRHIVLTHLDLDHAGGLPDFPDADVHVLDVEHRAAMERRTFFERERYLPAHWAHGPRWQLHAPRGERWNGFECVRDIPGLPPEILMLPVHGHTRGHAAIAVDTGAGWLVHCGDAYFHRREMDPVRPTCPPALAFFQRTIAMDDEARRYNQERLRQLARTHASDVRVFCAHDPVELDTARAAQRSA